MPVETFAYIDSLNASNPPGSDGLAQGDDHIRGIKTALKNSFTGITGATNVTQTTLNALQANTYAYGVPLGAIMDFTYVPTGWLELNGQAISRTTFSGLFSIWSTGFGAGDGSTTFNVPNLTDRYRRQRGAYAVNAFPGWLVGTHSHTASASTSVTVASDGTHSHDGATGSENVAHTHFYVTDVQGLHNHGATTGNIDTSLDHTHLVGAGGSVIAGWVGGGSFSGSNVTTNANSNTGGASNGPMNHAHPIVNDGLHQHSGNTNGENSTHVHLIGADGAHSHAGSSAATSVTVNNSATQENMPNSFVVITCVKY